MGDEGSWCCAGWSLLPIAAAQVQLLLSTYAHSTRCGVGGQGDPPFCERLKSAKGEGYMGRSTHDLVAGAGCREVLCQGSVLRLTQESNAEGGREQETRAGGISLPKWEQTQAAWINTQPPCVRRLGTTTSCCGWNPPPTHSQVQSQMHPIRTLNLT